VDAPGPRLESIRGHCERHNQLHKAPKWFDHWTTRAGLKLACVCVLVLLDRNVLLRWIRRGIRIISAVLIVAASWPPMLASMNEMDVPTAGLWCHVVFWLFGLGNYVQSV